MCKQFQDVAISFVWHPPTGNAPFIIVTAMKGSSATAKYIHWAPESPCTFVYMW